ncbi:hypothetical protein PF003_g38191 [Phytophthora fragariae]|nr:hypothetical protein PF003_g38191 [Phytophthora fragariae]
MVDEVATIWERRSSKMNARHSPPLSELAVELLPSDARFEGSDGHGSFLVVGSV